MIFTEKQVNNLTFGRFRKVTAIDNSLLCDSCPIQLTKGTIIQDRTRKLRLLNLILINNGNVTIDEIELKLIAFDSYGNALAWDDGKEYRICVMSELHCKPDETCGGEDVCVLPSEDCTDCCVFVTRVVTAGNVEMRFAESDYRMKNTGKQTLPSEQSPEKSRKLHKIMVRALAAACGVYAVLLVGGLIYSNVIAPAREESYITQCMEKGDYYAALYQIEKSGDKERREDVILQAVDRSLEDGNYKSALNYAAKSENPGLVNATLERVTDLLIGSGDYDAALNFAVTHKNQELQNSIYRRAVDECIDKRDFKSALVYVSLSGQDALRDQVYAAAVTYYKGEKKYGLALDYALKTGDQKLILTVYDDAILQYCAEEDYNSAAYYLAKCNLPADAAVTAEKKKEIYAAADRSFIRANTEVFYPTMTLLEKQKLFASTLAIWQRACGVTRSGTLVSNDGSFSWSGVVSVQCGPQHVVVLLADGTVAAQGSNANGQCDTGSWTGIVGIAAGQEHTVALKEDGTVVAVGKNDYRQCEVSGWTDIVQVACGAYFTLGLRSDGTVVACGQNLAGQCNVSEWKEITQISCGETHALGLRSDGTVVASGVQRSEKCNVSEWKNITAVSAGSAHSVALTADGKVLMAGGSDGSCGNVSGWSNIVAVEAGDSNVLGIDRYGNVFCVGNGKVPVQALQDLVGSY